MNLKKLNEELDATLKLYEKGKYISTSHAIEDLEYEEEVQHEEMIKDLKSEIISKLDEVSESTLLKIKKLIYHDSK